MERVMLNIFKSIASAALDAFGALAIVAGVLALGFVMGA
jgi:hypothetical protein